MRVLISPDKFKGTLTAPAAALAIAEGVRAAEPATLISLFPVADGGEGTLGTLLDAIGGTKRFVSSVDPWGRPSRPAVAMLDDGTICIESATSVYGDPLQADSRGLGLVIDTLMVDHPSSRFLIAIGGTASTDAGTGLARAMGWRFLDEQGRDLDPGGGALANLHRVVRPENPISIEVTGLCDVDAPLTGAGGSAQRFAPQKGASPDQVALLERGLRRLVDVVAADIGIDLEDVPGAGAGGGIGTGIVAFCSGRLVSGFDVVADAVQLRPRIQAADLVITGEGRFDEQSLHGKAAAGVARLSHEEGVPCVGLFGDVATSMNETLEAGFSDVMTIPKEGVAVSNPALSLSRAAEVMMSRQPA